MLLNKRDACSTGEDSYARRWRLFSDESQFANSESVAVSCDVLLCMIKEESCGSSAETGAWDDAKSPSRKREAKGRAIAVVSAAVIRAELVVLLVGNDALTIAVKAIDGE